MQYIKAFAAGFVATLIFHQGVYTLFYLGDPSLPAPYNMTVNGVGIPAIISTAFWAGLWGILAWLLIRGLVGVRYWLTAIVFGALGPTAVYLFAVRPLKGESFAADWSPVIIIAGLILNAAWGFGVALIMWWIERRSVAG